MSVSPIDTIYNDNKALLDFLEQHREYSFKSNLDNLFKKNLIMASASYFEDSIKNMIIDFISKEANSNDQVLSFLRSKGVERQYHTYFDWKTPSANPFFGLFGESFKNDILQNIRGDEALKKSVSDFLELGQLRNRLIHENFVTFYIDKTTDEVYNLYKSAEIFVSYLSTVFVKYLSVP